MISLGAALPPNGGPNDNKHQRNQNEHEPPVRLYKINVKNRQITRLTDNTDWIGSWSVSKDGKYVAAVHQKSLHYTFDQKVPPATMLHNLSDGTAKQIFTAGRIYPYGFEWAPDNSGFYAWAPYSSDCARLKSNRRKRRR